VLDGDLGCLADLLDDQETAMSLDHARDVQVLVAREDEKTPRVASDRFVPTARDFQRLGAVFAAALADEADEEAVALAVTDHEPRRFVVKTGHHQPPYDKVIREDAEFTIIQKTGEEGELVAERDPRSAG
jgi:hypothetical protein